MADKYIAQVNGQLAEIEATVVSSGVSSAGEIVGLDSTGRLSDTVMPVGIVPEVKNIISSENLSAGNLVNIFNNSGTANVRRADNSNGRKVHGFVLASTTSPAAALVYLEGTITGLSALTPGAQEYLGTAGAATETPPTGTGVLSQQIGTAISATEIAFAPQMTITLA